MTTRMVEQNTMRSRPLQGRHQSNESDTKKRSSMNTKSLGELDRRERVMKRPAADRHRTQEQNKQLI